MVRIFSRNLVKVAAIAAMTEDFVHNTAGVSVRAGICRLPIFRCLLLFQVRHLTGHDPTLAKRQRPQRVVVGCARTFEPMGLEEPWLRSDSKNTSTTSSGDL